ncbi:hypothetical protein Pth03_10690 [Planotetraspora thailandica]|uniref:Uncharacterized protein n=1 Tax=Planotetraspora thailandica TaxID=487172 RepID=A0A8J3V9S1_9ACTN|nr:hypothetical protein [Planotetraspora thailandica]GII52680.1 hypothetical protein Pth03_10690 [Planotetraspora thailandica]
MTSARWRRPLVYGLAGTVAGSALGLGGAWVLRSSDSSPVENRTPYAGHVLRRTPEPVPRVTPTPVMLAPTHMVGDPPLPGGLAPGDSRLPYTVHRHPELGFQTEATASRKVLKLPGWVRYQDVARQDRPYVDLSVRFSPQAADPALLAQGERDLFGDTQGYREYRWVIGTGGRFRGAWSVLETTKAPMGFYWNESVNPDTDFERTYMLYFHDGRGAAYEITASYMPEDAPRAAEEVDHMLRTFTLIGAKAPATLPDDHS